MPLPKVAVLMSTYNGEKYLKEQIDTILTQKKVDVTLFVRDDGSADNTWQILKRFSEKYENVRIYRGKNVGVGKSFIALLRKVKDYDYYAFADQDDLWLEEKLCIAIEKIRRYSEPALYASNQMLVDAEGRFLEMSDAVEPKHSLLDSIVRNYLRGCTMVFNKSLYECIVRKDFRPNNRILQIRYHDAWTTMVANLVGIICYDSNGYIKYRQHAANVVGAKTPTGIKAIKIRLSEYTGEKYRGMRSLCSRELLRGYANSISDDDKEALSLIANAHKPIVGLRLIFNKRIRNVFGESLPKMIVKAIVGWY